MEVDTPGEGANLSQVLAPPLTNHCTVSPQTYSRRKEASSLSGKTSIPWEAVNRGLTTLLETSAIDWVRTLLRNESNLFLFVKFKVWIFHIIYDQLKNVESEFEEKRKRLPEKQRGE